MKIKEWLDSWLELWTLFLVCISMFALGATVQGFLIYISHHSGIPKIDCGKCYCEKY